MDGFLSLAALAAAAYFLVWKDLIQPWLGLDKRAKPVKSSPPLPPYRARSRRSAGSNVVNAGSAQQSAPGEGSNVQNVQPVATAIVAAVGTDSSSSEQFTLTPRELQQLAETIAARAAGATVEEALARGFGVKKGGSAGYTRAKRLFDAATKAP